MPELSGKAALAVVEFAVHDDTDGQAASEVEVEYVHLVFGFAVGVFGIASGPECRFRAVRGYRCVVRSYRAGTVRSK